MEIGLIRRIDIDLEMQQAYLDYAMSVIVARALPDARDGLKPVHRRILYAMHDMGIRPDSEHKKSARIVGEVLGKYHPHGDMAVYESMARMAQDFSMRYLLVDGQGNFGSIDGDAPAAMRYTEARLTRMAADLLADIDKNTADFVPNFDNTLKEPEVLPAMVPNLLVNGSTGIAVGMATSIPPHNLGEVCDALVYMLDNWTRLQNVTVEDLMKHLQGPDFPTGGLILRDRVEAEGLSAAYGAGKGRITVQARLHTEDSGRGRTRIIITEMPYQINKTSLLERIADLARDGTLEGLADLRDESDRQGMRVVIELARTAEPEQVIKELYRRTPLQGTFSINMLALVNGEPRLLSLKQALKVYLDHRHEVVRRRGEHDLRRAKERAHVLEGYRVALAHLDAVIRLIRAAREADEARTKLQKHFKLTAIQADAILDMPLRRLAALERKKIDIEHKEKLALIKHLEGLLGSPKKMRSLIAEELKSIKASYGDRRRTQIVSPRELTPGAETRAALTLADLVPDQEVWVTLTAAGALSRAPARKFPKAGNEALIATVQASTRDTLYLIGEQGKASAIPAYSIPEQEDPAAGAPFASLSALEASATVAALVAVPAPQPASPAGERAAVRRGRASRVAAPGYLFMGTSRGMVKRIALNDMPGPSSQVINLMNIAEGDALGWARLTSGSEEVLLITAQGMGIRFEEEQVRPMGLSAAGVLGIKLTRDANADRVVGLDVIRPRADVLLLTSTGLARRTPVGQFPTQGRYGMGVQVWTAGRSGKSRLVGAAIGYGDDRLAVRTSQGTGRLLRFDAAPRRGRTGGGKALFKLRKEEVVSGLAPAAARFVVGAPDAQKKTETKKRARA